MLIGGNRVEPINFGNLKVTNTNNLIEVIIINTTTNQKEKIVIEK